MRTLTFPNTRDAIFEIVDSREFVGWAVTAYYRLQPDFTQHLPAVLIFGLGGEQSGPARTDRIGIEVYGIGTATDQVAEAIAATLTAGHHMTGAGRIDRVVVEATPHNVPYADPAISQSSAVYRATTRPL